MAIPRTMTCGWRWSPSRRRPRHRVGLRHRRSAGIGSAVGTQPRLDRRDLAGRVSDVQLPRGRTRRAATGVPYRDDRNDLEALAAPATRRRRGWSISPTRIILPAHGMPPRRMRLSGRGPGGMSALLDEAYFDFAPSTEPCRDIDDPRTNRLRTFSKAYGMAGARIGYALGPADMMQPSTASPALRHQPRRARGRAGFAG